MVLKTAVKRKMHYPFKWIQLNVNVKIGWCILKNCSHSRARFEHVFLKKIHQKWKYYRKEKQNVDKIEKNRTH